MLLRALELLETPAAAFHAQEESEATFAPKFTKAQGRIDWRQSAESITRLVRATIPWPGATTALQGSALKLWKVTAEETGSSPHRELAASPGMVIEVRPESIRVATGRGNVEISEIQPAGRRRMSVREFLAGHHIAIGDQLTNA